MKVNIGDILEVAIDVAPELEQALRKDSPGGRKITWGECLKLGMAIARAIYKQRKG